MIFFTTLIGVSATSSDGNLAFHLASYPIAAVKGACCICARFLKYFPLISPLRSSHLLLQTEQAHIQELNCALGTSMAHFTHSKNQPVGTFIGAALPAMPAQPPLHLRPQIPNMSWIVWSPLAGQTSRDKKIKTISHNWTSNKHVLNIFWIVWDPSTGPVHKLQ